MISNDNLTRREILKTAANPVTGLAESVGYVRGLLAALA
jgi:hypothetical protein